MIFWTAFSAVILHRFLAHRREQKLSRKLTGDMENVHSVKTRRFSIYNLIKNLIGDVLTQIKCMHACIQTFV